MVYVKDPYYTHSQIIHNYLPSLDVLDGHVLAVEADVVTRHGLGEGLVVHLHRLHLCIVLAWNEVMGVYRNFDGRFYDMHNMYVVW